MPLSGTPAPVHPYLEGTGRGVTHTETLSTSNVVLSIHIYRPVPGSHVIYNNKFSLYRLALSSFATITWFCKQVAVQEEINIS